MELKIGDYVKVVSLENTRDPFGIDYGMEGMIGNIYKVEEVCNGIKLRKGSNTFTFTFHKDDLEKVDIIKEGDYVKIVSLDATKKDSVGINDYMKDMVGGTYKIERPLFGRQDIFVICTWNFHVDDLEKTYNPEADEISEEDLEAASIHCKSLLKEEEKMEYKFTERWYEGITMISIDNLNPCQDVWAKAIRLFSKKGYTLQDHIGIETLTEVAIKLGNLDWLLDKNIIDIVEEKKEYKWVIDRSHLDAISICLEESGKIVEGTHVSFYKEDILKAARRSGAWRATQLIK